MSLILDALRKMETERKARQQRSVELRSEVLSYRGAAPVAAKKPAGLVVAGALVVAALAGGGYYITRPEGDADRPAASVRTAKPETARVVVPAAEPVPPAAPMPAPVATAPPLPANDRSPERNAAPDASVPSTRAVPVQQKSADEGLAVTGIAWQDERSLRRAVINGALVGEGAELAGARVVEIKENRVRFSRGGSIFEVVNAAGSGR